MFVYTDQYYSASKALYESQRTALATLTRIAVEGMEKVVTLHLGVLAHSTEKVTSAAKDLLATKDPQAFLVLTTAYAKPDVEKSEAYRRNLTEIVSSTKEEYAKFADIQVTDAKNKVGAWVDSIAKNAPAGAENVLSMLKTSVANANAGYEQMSEQVSQQVSQINQAGMQAVDAAQAQLSRVS